MSSEFAPSETTPLRTAGNSAVGINVNNNSIRIESDLPPVTKESIMDNKKILCKVTIDFIILMCVGFPILFFYLWGEPYKRGFFCDDNSIRHPFHESTVKSWMLYIIGIVLPILIIVTTEIIHTNLKAGSAGREYKFLEWDIPPWVVQAYKQIGFFGFGAAVSQFITDIGKYSIGRLRPHFITVCQPVLKDGSNCSSPQNFGKYIEDFTCVGKLASKEMRLSFPSGHSSFSVYTMIYCTLYLQSRMTWSGSKLAKHFFQFLLVILAWYTALSRVSDYKHHWSDVLGGAVIGVVCALAVANCVSDLFEKRNIKYLPTTRHEVTTTINTSNGRA